ncbi:MAG: hypothetical protein AAGN46_10830, partial [Acidobacteriota bacterium]
MRFEGLLPCVGRALRLIDGAQGFLQVASQRGDLRRLGGENVGLRQALCLERRSSDRPFLPQLGSFDLACRSRGLESLEMTRPMVLPFEAISLLFETVPLSLQNAHHRDFLGVLARRLALKRRGLGLKLFVLNAHSLERR